MPRNMFGLRSEEVLQKNFLNLDSGLPVEQLRAPIRAGLGSEGGDPAFTETVLDAVNRRSTSVTVRVTGTPLRTNARETGPAA